jgi:hypothetical protein
MQVAGGQKVDKKEDKRELELVWTTRVSIPLPPAWASVVI